MGWSLKLGRVAGIRVQVHFTFLIFMIWIVLGGLIAGKGHETVQILKDGVTAFDDRQAAREALQDLRPQT